MGCTCSKLDQQKQNRRKYPYRNTSNPRPNVEAFGGSQSREDHSTSPTGIAGFSDHGASQERARSLGEETVNTGETSSTYVRSPAAVALTARYQSAAVSAHPSLSPTPGSARTHHVNYASPGSTAPSPFAVGKGPVYINGNPDGVVTVDEADAPSPSPPSSDSDTDSDAETTTSSDAGGASTEEGGTATQKTTTGTGGAASPTRREGTLSQPRDVAPVPSVDGTSPPRAGPLVVDVPAAGGSVTTPVRTPSRGAAVGRGSVSLDLVASPPATEAPAAGTTTGDGVLSPNPLRGGSADRAVELAVAASAKKKARKVEPFLAPLEPSSAPAVALVNQTPRKVALDGASPRSSDDEEGAQDEEVVSSNVDDDAGDVDVSPPDSPMTSIAPSPTTADAVEESKVARAIIQDEKAAAVEKKKAEVVLAPPPPPPAPTLAAAEVAKLLTAHTGPAKNVSNEEEQAWQGLCRRHTTGVTAVLRATREEYNRLTRQLEDAQQRARKTVDTEQLGAIGRIRREFEEKLKK